MLRASLPRLRAVRRDPHLEARSARYGNPRHLFGEFLPKLCSLHMYIPMQFILMTKIISIAFVSGRYFDSSRISKHEQICKKTSTKKRKVFNATKMRMEGTEAEPYIRVVSAKSTKTTAPAPSTASVRVLLYRWYKNVFTLNFN